MLGKKVVHAMEKIIKAFYVAIVAMVVFLGGLLISQGMQESQKGTPAQEAVTPRVIIYREGTAL